jgi:hypothetical protein
MTCKKAHKYTHLVWMPDSRSAASNSPAEPTTWYRGVVTLHVYTETMIRRSLYASLHGCYTLQDFSYFPNCFMTFTHKSLIKHTQRLQVLRVVWVVQLVVEGCAKGGQLHSQLLSMGALQSWTDDLVLSLHQLHIPHIPQPYFSTHANNFGSDHKFINLIHPCHQTIKGMGFMQLPTEQVLLSIVSTKDTSFDISLPHCHDSQCRL